MAIPVYATRSYAGGANPTYLTSVISGVSVPAGQTFTIGSTAGWTEVNASGQNTSNVLGTSGPFVVVVDYGTSTEEKILCSTLATGTNTVTVWTDGALTGRGYDNSGVQAHASGTAGTNNVFPVLSAAELVVTNQFISSLPNPVFNSVTASSISGTTVSGNYFATNGLVAPLSGRFIGAASGIPAGTGTAGDFSVDLQNRQLWVSNGTAFIASSNVNKYNTPAGSAYVTGSYTIPTAATTVNQANNSGWASVFTTGGVALITTSGVAGLQVPVTGYYQINASQTFQCSSANKIGRAHD